MGRREEKNKRHESNIESISEVKEVTLYAFLLPSAQG